MGEPPAPERRRIGAAEARFRRFGHPRTTVERARTTLHQIVGLGLLPRSR